MAASDDDDDDEEGWVNVTSEWQQVQALQQQSLPTKVLPSLKVNSLMLSHSLMDVGSRQAEITKKHQFQCRAKR